MVIIPLQYFEELRKFKMDTLDKLPEYIIVIGSYGQREWRTTAQVKDEIKKDLVLYFENWMEIEKLKLNDTWIKRIRNKLKSIFQ